MSLSVLLTFISLMAAARRLISPAVTSKGASLMAHLPPADALLIAKFNASMPRRVGLAENSPPILLEGFRFPVRDVA